MLQYLKPYQPFFPRDPGTDSPKIGLPAIVPLLGVRRSSQAMVYEYFNGKRPMPIETFVKLLNALEIADPSWLFYLTYRRELDRYFDAVPHEGGVVLVTKPTGDQTALDYEGLSHRGLGGLIYAARVRQRVSLKELGRKMGALDRAKGAGIDNVWHHTLRKYEQNLKTPDTGLNAIYLDLFIEALKLNPSAAYIAAGHPWVPQLIRVYPHADWKKTPQTAQPIAPLMAAPYDVDRPEYEVRLTPLRVTDRQGHGFGGFLRQARLLSGLEIKDAEQPLDLCSGGLNDHELYGEKCTFPLLERMARLYERAIRAEHQYSEDPLKELVIRHNRRYYPKVPIELYQNEPVFFTSPRDARWARELLPLPPGHVKRRLFVFRTSRGLDLEGIGRWLGIKAETYRRIEDPRQGHFPSWYLLQKMAALTGEKDAKKWRQAVRETFYPEISWEFLEAAGLYLASPEDVQQIKSLAVSGEISRDGYPWRRFKETHTIGPTPPTTTSQATNGGLFSHVKGCYRGIVPTPSRDRGFPFPPDTPYLVLDLNGSHGDQVDRLTRTIVQTVEDLLPSHPQLIVRIGLHAPQGMKALGESLKKTVLVRGEPTACVLVVSNGHQIHLRRAGKQVSVTMCDENTANMEVTVLMGQTDRLVTLAKSGGQSESPYPTPKELLRQAMEVEGISQKELPKRIGVEEAIRIYRLYHGHLDPGWEELLDQLATHLPTLNKRLFLAQILPGVAEFAPEMVTQGGLAIEDEGSIEKALDFALPTLSSTHKNFIPIVRSLGLLYGIPARFIWLRFCPIVMHWVTTLKK